MTKQMTQPQRSALVLSGGAVLAALVLVLGINISSESLGSGQPAKKPVSTPIESPHATVAPSVAAEMNGPRSKVKLANGIKMHAPAKGQTGRVGNGQGNGCLKNYGEPGQCLPEISLMQQQMPDMDHPWDCAQVRELFPDGIAVHGKDTLGLDRDGDHTMCDPGDG